MSSPGAVQYRGEREVDVMDASNYVIDVVPERVQNRYHSQDMLTDCCNARPSTVSMICTREYEFLVTQKRVWHWWHLVSSTMLMARMSKNRRFFIQLRGRCHAIVNEILMTCMANCWIDVYNNKYSMGSVPCTGRQELDVVGSTMGKRWVRSQRHVHEPALACREGSIAITVRQITPLCDRSRRSCSFTPRLTGS